MEQYSNILKYKHLGIYTQNENVVYMREDCHVCISEGFEALTRIRVSMANRSIIASLNVINSEILLNVLPRIDDIKNYQLIAYFLLLNEKFLICLTLFLLSFWVKWDKEMFGFVSIVSITYIFILFIIFLSTPHDLYWQLNSTAARVIKSLSFLLAFFSLYNLRNWKIIY